MSTPVLHLSDDLELPLSAVTDTFGILGKRGSGKTSAAVVMFEELFAAGVPVVAVDPKGDWYGVRSSADGKGRGLAVYVFGGQHGDAPLEASAGVLMADLIVDSGLSCVLDVSEFSRADLIRFLLAFGTHLYRRAGGSPLHVIAEECHEYLPQVVRGEDARMVGAWQRLVKAGRFKGIGITLVSQRSAAVNKDVLEQVDNLFVLRTTGPRDRAAVKAWVDTHAEPSEIMDSLPSLAAGESWLWSPETLGGARRFRFRMRHTYDAGATPKVGEKRRAPAVLAPVDLDAIRAAMAATIEKAEAEDPKRLKAQVAKLRRDLDAANDQIAHLAESSVVEVEKETLVPHFPADWADQWYKVLSAAKAFVAESNALDALVDQSGPVPSALPASEIRGTGVPAAAPRPSPERRIGRQGRQPPKPPAPPSVAPRPPAPAGIDDGAGLRAGERKMLGVLASRHPLWVTKAQLATLSKFKVTGGTFGTYLSVLRRRGLIDVNDKDIRISEAGLAVVGTDVEAPQTTEELLAMWHKALRAGERALLDLLVAAYPGSINRADLGTQAGFEPTGGTFGTYLSVLKRNGLVDVEGNDVRASDTLFMEGA